MCEPIPSFTWLATQFMKLLFVNFNHNIVAVDFYFVRQRILCRWHAGSAACANIEFRPVARTLDLAPLVLAIAERAAIVCANVVDAEVLFSQLKQDHQTVIRLDQ